MATTNQNCVHAPVCAYMGQAYENCNKCPLFVDNRQFFVLPKPLETPAYLVRKMRYDRDGYGMSFVYYWGIEKVKFQVRYFDLVGKTLFFDEKEAEAYVKILEKEHPLDNF